MATHVNIPKLLAKVCKHSFWRFCQEFWEEIPGSGILIPNWHMEYLCSELQEIAERVFRNEPKKHDLLVNISPGSSKSSLASILFPAWIWARDPSMRMITASHTDDLVLDLANKSRTVIKSDLYQSCFPEVQIRDDQDTKGYYATTRGGDRKTCTIAGKSPTGFHGSFLIIDDPIDPKRAVSEVELKIANAFYDTVVPSRKVNKEVSVEITIMQRLHVDDPTGHLLERAKRENTAKIRHVCLPAELFEESNKYMSVGVSPPELTERYQDGLMDPIRLSRNVLQRERATMGAYAYAGQYLQNPIPMSGGMFAEHYFNQRVKAAPYNAKRIRYWDRASSTSVGACYTAGVLMAKDAESNFYIEDVIHGQWEPNERNQRMRAAALKDRNRYGKYEPVIWVEAEGGSSGRDAWKAVARALAGFNVKEDRVSGSKETRAEPWAAQLAAGNVYVVDNGTWDIPHYIAEHCAFPLGKIKDLVDSSTGAFNLLVNMKVAVGSLRVYTFKKTPDKNVPQIIVTNKEEMESLLLENHHRCLLVVITDPEPVGRPGDLPMHAIAHILAHTTLQFTDHNPENYQENWNDLIAPYDRSVEDLMMYPAHGKSLWSFLRKQRQEIPNVLLFCDMQGKRRAVSIAYAVADVMRWDRSCVSFSDNEDHSEEVLPHIYDVMKAARSSVL